MCISNIWQTSVVIAEQVLSFYVESGNVSVRLSNCKLETREEESIKKMYK